MKFYGDINMQQNELQQAVIQIETNFPSAPVPGRIVFKNQILYICIEIDSGTPVWVPLTNEIESYEFVQSASASTWNVNHNLNTSLPSVQVYGADNKVLFPDDIEIIDNNNVQLTFGQLLTGRAIILTGSQTGAARPSFAFEYTQSEPSTTWVVVHNLGYIPVVRVFIGNDEVQPLSITHDSLFQTTITFSTPAVGIARFI